MAGQLNPFRLRAPSVSVSASDLMRGQELMGSHIQGGITGLSDFGKQANTNELNSQIASGLLEGKSTDEAQQLVASLGLTGGVTKDMNTFMEQGHQGRQQEDRQREATDVASLLFKRQEETARQKAQTAKDLVDYKIANPTAKSLINTGAGIYDPNEKKWIAGPDGTTKQPFKPTGQIGSAYKNATGNGKKAIELGASIDPNFNVRPVKIGKDKSGNDKFSKTNFEYLYNGNVYENPETLLTEIEKSQEQQSTQPTVIGGQDARPVNPNQVNAENIGPMDTRGLEGMFDRTVEGISGLFGGKDEASNVTANQLLTSDNTTNGKAKTGYDELARVAGVPTEQMNKTITRLSEIESGGAGYTALNKGSGAYGKYQLIPSTAKAYSDRLGFKGDEWKTPENQELMFQELTKDNINGLKRAGLPTDTFHLYGAHQQGLQGIKNILNNEVSSRTIRNMRSNLPSKLRKLPDTKIRDAWIKHWKPKTK